MKKWEIYRIHMKAALEDKIFWLTLLICAFFYQTIYAKIASVLFIFFYWPLAFTLMEYMDKKKK